MSLRSGKRLSVCAMMEHGRPRSTCSATVVISFEENGLKEVHNVFNVSLFHLRRSALHCMSSFRRLFKLLCTVAIVDKSLNFMYKSDLYYGLNAN